MSRDKGNSGEREAIRVLGDELGDRIEQELTRNLQQARDGGLGGDVLGLGLWRIEIKRAKRKTLAAWWSQAVEQCDGAGWPALMYRIDYDRSWHVCVHISDLKAENFGDWPKSDHSGVVEMSVQAFCSVVREMDREPTIGGHLPDMAQAAREVC